MMGHFVIVMIQIAGLSEMQWVFPFLIGGLFFGAFAMHERKRALELLRKTFEAEISADRQKQIHAEETNQKLEKEQTEQGQQIQELTVERQQLTADLAAALEKSSRMVDLENLVKSREACVADLQEKILQSRTRETELDTALSKERKNHQEKVELLTQAGRQLSDAFKSLSSDALKSNNEQFLKLASATREKYQIGAQGDLEKRRMAIQELVKPLKESLDKVDSNLRQVEKNRTQDYTSLTEQLKNITSAHSQLQQETGNLVKALRAPSVRGRWGEIQLKRVVEMAGMIEYCDFTVQETVYSEEGRLRPDLVISLPNQKQIIVDSKAPLQAYLDALECDDESERRAYLVSHARQVRTHLNQLGQKSYWKQFKSTPEFVVMFLPGETFFSAALEQDPELIEYGVRQRVILATPTTLIALLRAVAYGWRQEQLTKHAHQVSHLGKELYDRIHVLSGHFLDLKKGLDRSLDSYNKTVASLEGRLLSTARKFKELGAGGEKEIQEPEIIEKSTRDFQSKEMKRGSSKTNTEGE